MFFFPSTSMLSTSVFSSTELASEWSNKVVSIATKQQVTDSQRCQSSCCQAHRTSTHFVILNIEPLSVPNGGESGDPQKLTRLSSVWIPVRRHPSYQTQTEKPFFKHQRDASGYHQPHYDFSFSHFQMKCWFSVFLTTLLCEQYSREGTRGLHNWKCARNT